MTRWPPPFRRRGMPLPTARRRRRPEVRRRKGSDRRRRGVERAGGTWRSLAIALYESNRHESRRLGCAQREAGARIRTADLLITNLRRKTSEVSVFRRFYRSI